MIQYYYWKMNKNIFNQPLKEDASQITILVPWIIIVFTIGSIFLNIWTVGVVGLIYCIAQCETADKSVSTCVVVWASTVLMYKIYCYP